MKYDICYRPVIFLLAAGSAICGATVMSDVSQWDSFGEVGRRLSGTVEVTPDSGPLPEEGASEAYVGLEQESLLDFSGTDLQLTQNETL